MMISRVITPIIPSFILHYSSSCFRLNSYSVNNIINPRNCFRNRLFTINNKSLFSLSCDNLKSTSSYFFRGYSSNNQRVYIESGRRNYSGAYFWSISSICGTILVEEIVRRQKKRKREINRIQDNTTNQPQDNDMKIEESISHISTNLFLTLEDFLFSSLISINTICEVTRQHIWLVVNKMDDFLSPIFSSAQKILNLLHPITLKYIKIASLPFNFLNYLLCHIYILFDYAFKKLAVCRGGRVLFFLSVTRLTWEFIEDLILPPLLSSISQSCSYLPYLCSIGIFFILREYSLYDLTSQLHNKKYLGLSWNPNDNQGSTVIQTYCAALFCEKSIKFYGVFVEDLLSHSKNSKTFREYFKYIIL